MEGAVLRVRPHDRRHDYRAIIITVCRSGDLPGLEAAQSCLISGYNGISHCPGMDSR